MKSSPTVRWLWIAAGWISLALAIIGVLLPLIPGTPFFILTAFCFSRGSARLHAWLLADPRVGPMIINWQTHGAIGVRARWSATALIILSMSYPVGFGPIPIWLKTLLAVIGVSVITFLHTRPTGPRDPHTPNNQTLPGNQIEPS